MTPDSTKQVEKRLAEILNAVSQESMRGKILILTAHIDHLLREMLKRFFKPPRAKEHDLLSKFGALDSAYSRIEAAYRLGLIDKDDADALDSLRKIRNHCAHDVAHFSLEAEPHKTRFLDFAKRTMQAKNRVLFLGDVRPNSTEDYVMWLSAIYILELEVGVTRLDQTPDRFIRDKSKTKAAS